MYLRKEVPQQYLARSGLAIAPHQPVLGVWIAVGEVLGKKNNRG